MNKKEFIRPKSICKCGHSGDGRKSAHMPLDGPLIIAGQGSCTKCDCVKFTWKKFTDKYLRYIKG